MSQDAFALFQISPSFQVDLKDLEERYFKLQRVLHPDRSAGKSERDLVLAAKKSADLNEAYETLKDPLLRGKYLLEETERSAETHQDPGLLEEILSWQETLSRERDEKMRKEFLQERHADFERTLEALERAFEEGNKERARILLVRLSYLKKICEG